MKNILLVQPDWPKPAKIKDPQKYFPYPLLKLASLERLRGNNVALVIGNQNNVIPFTPDEIFITTVFSWWFPYVQACVDSYHFLYPNATIHIGGVHATLTPGLYRERFPFADVHVGKVYEAEELEPAWDLLPGTHKTQIIRFSQGCIRHCSFCYCHYEPYQAFDFEEVAQRIRYNRLILDDHNFLAHPQAREILQRLSVFEVNGKPISSIEVQGGYDIRLLSRSLDIVPLLKKARVRNVRLAWDGGLEHLPMLETCLKALQKEGFRLRDLRCYMLYNHNVPFDDIVEKLRHFERFRIGPIHSRFRPVELLRDGYVPQKKQQTGEDYYIHQGWSDRQVRVVGSLASDISRMARANVTTLDEVRKYYGRPSVEETLRRAA